MPGRRPDVAIPCVMLRSRSSTRISTRARQRAALVGREDLAEEAVVDRLQLARLLV